MSHGARGQLDRLETWYRHDRRTRTDPLDVVLLDRISQGLRRHDLIS
jgi:hypothetical protein